MFEKNHHSAKELLAGFYKVGTKKPCITWSESVDEASCFGWIDGVRKSIDEESYCIRFTPRKSGSIWSDINIKKVEILSKQGLMHSSGLGAFSRRQENKSRIYSYEKEPSSLPKDFLKQFKAKKGMEIFSINGSYLSKELYSLDHRRETGSNQIKKIGRINS